MAGNRKEKVLGQTSRGVLSLLYDTNLPNSSLQNVEICYKSFKGQNTLRGNTTEYICLLVPIQVWRQKTPGGSSHPSACSLVPANTGKREVATSCYTGCQVNQDELTFMKISHVNFSEGLFTGVRKSHCSLHFSALRSCCPDTKLQHVSFIRKITGSQFQVILY